MAGLQEKLKGREQGSIWLGERDMSGRVAGKTTCSLYPST